MEFVHFGVVYPNGTTVWIGSIASEFYAGDILNALEALAQAPGGELTETETIRFHAFPLLFPYSKGELKMSQRAPTFEEKLQRIGTRYGFTVRHTPRGGLVLEGFASIARLTIDRRTQGLKGRWYGLEVISDKPFGAFQLSKDFCSALIGHEQSTSLALAGGYTKSDELLLERIHAAFKAQSPMGAIIGPARYLRKGRGRKGLTEPEFLPYDEQGNAMQPFRTRLKQAQDWAAKNGIEWLAPETSKQYWDRLAGGEQIAPDQESLTAYDAYFDDCERANKTPLSYGEWLAKHKECSE